jgi:hypothetical protein
MGLVSEATAAVDQSLRSFGLRFDAARCPTELQGKWRVDKASSATLCPFVAGANAQNAIRIVDKTALSSKNVTQVTLDGVETKTKSKTGRKEYMLSGTVCGDDKNTSVVTCRLFQRGDGWETRQERTLMNENKLRERNVLVSPGKKDVVVDRFFDRVPREAGEHG